MIRFFVLLPALLSLCPSSGQCTPDQVQDQWNGGTSERNLPGYFEWQSFTAGLDGELCQVDLLFCNTTTPVVGSGTLQVFAGQGIGGALLTSQPVMVDGSASPANQPCWQQWTLANPPALLAGQQYTFQFVPTQGGGLPDPYLIQIQLPGTYAGGQNHNLGAQGDCAFRTHVNTGGVGMAEQAPWSLRVYPNPAHDRLTVELPDNTEARLRVFDAMGQLVLEAVSHADRTELDLSGLKPGHYVVQVISSEHAGTACILRW